jgi:hypothetical protein
MEGDMRQILPLVVVVALAAGLVTVGWLIFAGISTSPSRPSP